MATWHDFTHASPALAAEVRGLFYGHDVALGFLATVRPDGGPRVHPICPLIGDGLHAFVVPGPKLADLRRDGRYALHCETYPPPDHDDAAYVTGRAAEVTSVRRRSELTKVFFAERHLDTPWPGFEEQVLFDLDVETVLLTRTAPRGGFPQGHTTWRA